MNREYVIATLKANESALKGAGATALFLFGSTARGESEAGSDVDLFVDYDEASDFSIVELCRLQRMLSTCLAAPVDLTTRAGLHPVIRDHVLAEATRVF